MTARDIQWLLAKQYGSPFFARRHLAVIPNVSWGFGLDWEADMIVCSKARYLTEIEIKISMSDWKADASKKKHKMFGNPDNRIKFFYYAAPKALALRYAELGLPENYGIIAIENDRVEVLKKAKKMMPHREITTDEVFTLLRLGSLKLWDRREPIKEEIK